MTPAYEDWDFTDYKTVWKFANQLGGFAPTAIFEGAMWEERMVCEKLAEGIALLQNNEVTRRTNVQAARKEREAMGQRDAAQAKLHRIREWIRKNEPESEILTILDGIT